MNNRIFTCITNTRRPHGETVFSGVFNVMHLNRLAISGNLLDMYNLGNIKALKITVIITEALKQCTESLH